MKDSDKSKEQLLSEISQLRQQVETLQSSNKTFEAILEKAPILISVKDLKGNITLANQRFNVLEHFAYEEFVGHNIYELFPDDVADALWKDDLKALAGNALVESEQAMTHTDKSTHVYYTVKFPIADKAAEVFGICSLSYDITEIKQSLELSINDRITGLYSRHYFNMCFQGELTQSKRNHTLFTLILVDIDQFDTFQNNYGNSRTDELVTTVAEMLQNICCRTKDLCFRLKDQRLACMLPATDEKDIEFIAEEIRSYVASLSIEHTENTPYGHVTVSIGYTMSYFQDTLGQKEICAMAKEALIKAKDQGGNQICMLRGEAQQVA
ncbi:MAG: diguanylate cyclase (GGDEF)-like protein/PAS domain S-box-containing protein [Phenylobacterium sp.]|jgi:diguanylate cyclase (GGDEF)-like protein/PAS domain S-box-containing protein